MVCDILQKKFRRNLEELSSPLRDKCEIKADSYRGEKKILTRDGKKRIWLVLKPWKGFSHEGRGGRFDFENFF